MDLKVLFQPHILLTESQTYYSLFDGMHVSLISDLCSTITTAVSFFCSSPSISIQIYGRDPSNKHCLSCGFSSKE